MSEMTKTFFFNQLRCMQIDPSRHSSDQLAGRLIQCSFLRSFLRENYILAEIPFGENRIRLLDRLEKRMGSCYEALLRGGDVTPASVSFTIHSFDRFMRNLFESSGENNMLEYNSVEPDNFHETKISQR